MKSGSTTSFSTCKGNWRLAHPFTKPCEEVICLERIMPIQNSAQGADVEPGQRGIGWESCAAWREQGSLPVYAMGGRASIGMEYARAHGAQGIAALRGLWNP